MSIYNNDHDNIKVDDIINDLGFGWYQLSTYTFTFIAVAIYALDSSIYVFTARDSQYRCKIDACEQSNFTYSQSWTKELIPLEGEQLSKCYMYEVSENVSHSGEYSCDKSLFNHNNTITCQKWVSDNPHTVVTDFSIFCQSWKVALIGTANGIGQLIGLTYSGYLADKYGSKNIMVFTTVGSGTIRILQSFAFDYWSFLCLECFSQMLGAGDYSTAYVLSLEILTPKMRTIGSTFISIMASTFLVVLALSAWVIPSWRILLRVLYISSFVMLLCPRVVPHSLRWLLVKKRTRDAISTIKHAAKWNGTISTEKIKSHIEHLEASILEHNIQNGTKEDKKDGEQFVNIFQSRNLRLRLGFCAFCWICSNLVYFGLSLNAVSLSGNEHLNFILVALMDYPAFMTFIFVLRVFGRRKSQFWSFILCAVACVLYICLPSNWVSLSIVLYMTARFFITIAFNVIYIYTAEMFPTSVRNSCLCFCALAGSLGRIIAPQTALLGKPSLILSIYACIVFVAGFCALTFPETSDKPLPDTIENMERERNKKLPMRESDFRTEGM